MGADRAENGQKLGPRAHTEGAAQTAASLSEEPGKPWAIGNLGMPGAAAAQPLTVELPGGGLGWVAPNDMRVVNAVPGTDGTMMYQPFMAPQSALSEPATPERFGLENMPLMSYGAVPQSSGYGAELQASGGFAPLTLQTPDQKLSQTFAQGMPGGVPEPSKVVLPGDAQRLRNTQEELATLGMPQIGFGADGLARLEVPGKAPQGRQTTPGEEELASLGISGAVPQGTSAMLAPELARLGIHQGSALGADMQTPGVQYQYVLPGAAAGSGGGLPQGALSGSVMMGAPEMGPAPLTIMSPGSPGAAQQDMLSQPFAVDALGNPVVPAQAGADTSQAFAITPAVQPPAVQQAAVQPPAAQELAVQPAAQQAVPASATPSELSDQMASETEEVVDKAVARAMEVLKAKKKEAAFAEAKVNEAKAKRKLMAEKKAVGGSRTLAEMTSDEQTFAEKASASNAAAENRERAVAKQSAERAAAEKVASAAQKAVAKSAAHTAAAEQAAAAAEKVVADLGPHA